MKNQRKKILFITPYFHSQTGGLENYVFNIARGLNKNYGWEVVVITSNQLSKKTKQESIENMKVYRLPVWFKISNTPINPTWYFQIKNILKKEKPDIINAHSPVPFISDISALLNRKIPFILTYHTGSMILKNNLLFDYLIKIYESFFLKVTLNKTAKIICSSDYVRLVFLKDYANKSLTITPGVDIDRFKVKNCNPKEKILFVGSLKKAENYKGLEYLLRAVKIIKERHKNLQLLVVGDGDYKSNYKKIAKKLGIERNVTFEGKLCGDDLVKSYQQTNVFVLPSLFDSCPLVLLEAMSCGKPVIGTNTCGIPYLIDHEKNGLLVPPKDPKALAKAIIKILENPLSAKKMGEEGYKKVRECFSWKNQVKITNNILLKSLKKV